MAVILWTVRLALPGYAAVLAGHLLWARRGGRAEARWNTAARWIWSLSALLFLAHVAAALHFYHGWSWSHLIGHTADATEALLGVRFGHGVVLSFLFLLVWMADAAWWWIDRDGYERRPLPAALAIHAFLFFLAVNGAIVFEAGPTRWVGLAILAALLPAAALRLRQFRRDSSA